MSNSRRQRLKNRKRRIQRRLRKREWAPQGKPMFTASNVHYELSGKARLWAAIGPPARLLSVRSQPWGWMDSGQ